MKVIYHVLWAMTYNIHEKTYSSQAHTDSLCDLLYDSWILSRTQITSPNSVFFLNSQDPHFSILHFSFPFILLCLLFIFMRYRLCDEVFWADVNISDISCHIITLASTLRICPQVTTLLAVINWCFSNASNCLRRCVDHKTATIFLSNAGRRLTTTDSSRGLGEFPEDSATAALSRQYWAGRVLRWLLCAGKPVSGADNKDLRGWLAGRPAGRPVSQSDGLGRCP